MDGIARMVRSVTTVGMLAGALLAGGGVHAQTGTVPPETVPPPFAPITLADVGPVTTNQSQVGWLGMSGEWALYALAQPGCGHCQPFINQIYAQNLGNTQRVMIPTAMADFYGGSRSSIGASD